MPRLSLKSALGTDDPTEVVTRLEALKSALNDAPNSIDGFVPALPGYRAPDPTPSQQLAKATTALDTITELAKGASIGDTVASLKAQLAAAQPDLVKDLTLTSPLSTGYVAYDLEAPCIGRAAA